MRLNRESGANPERSRRCNRERGSNSHWRNLRRAAPSRNGSQKNYLDFDSVPPAMDRIGDAIDRYFCALLRSGEGLFLWFFTFPAAETRKARGKGRNTICFSVRDWARCATEYQRNGSCLTSLSIGFIPYWGTYLWWMGGYTT